MRNFRLLFILSAVLCVAGCATTSAPDGGASATRDGDAPAVVKNFVDSHAAIMSELAQSREHEKQLDATAQKTLEAAQRNLEILEDMSHRLGAGEITLFFPVGSANLESAERERLVNFADFLSRESRGRKILFVSIGSASSFGNYKTNMLLAQKRSEAPMDVLDKYLINVPHDFHKVYGTGDLYSPKKVKMKEHQRYQNARLIAVFDASELPQNLNQPGN